MYAGVGKSGSPAPNPITGRPAAFSALALASTASVADSAIPPIRAEIRGFAAGAPAGTGNAEGTASLIGLWSHPGEPGGIVDPKGDNGAGSTSPVPPRRLNHWWLLTLACHAVTALTGA